MFIISFFELSANSVDPDQTPRSAASDLGLYCLPVSLLWDAKLIWVDIGNKFCDFLSGFLYTKPLLERIYSKRKEFAPRPFQKVKHFDKVTFLENISVSL